MYRARDDVENELIARVRAGDLAARLVYADMLEQRGELSRAMFLRYLLTEQDGPWLAAIGWTSRDFASSSLASDDGPDECCH